jgi:predicted RNase H-like nuclease
MLDSIRNEAWGIDGCRSGWVVATANELFVMPLLEVADHVVIGIDMPIGLPRNEPRACDREARRFLGRRSSTVFPAPARHCLGAGTHAEASQRSRVATGRGLSIQAFHLLPKIAEVDALMTPARETHIAEVHPECAFVRMNDGGPLPPKRTSEGAAIRRALLTRHVDVRPTPRGAAPDDVLDAYAVLWSTQRFARRQHVEFGDGSRDERGLLMRIVS